jgi:hypothetical protein
LNTSSAVADTALTLFAGQPLFPGCGYHHRCLLNAKEAFMQFVIIHDDDSSGQAEPDGHPESDVSGFPGHILLAVVILSFALSAEIGMLYTSVAH